MKRQKRVKMICVTVRLDRALLTAYTKWCKRKAITREGAIRAHMSAVTKVRSVRRPAASLIASEEPVKKTRSKPVPRVDTNAPA